MTIGWTVATVGAVVELSGASVGEAEALWYDLARRPSFVDGFGHVDRTEGRWPQVGSRVVWTASRGPRGRVVERVTAYAPGTGQVTEMEEARLLGTQRVEFAARPGGVRMRLALAYELKERGLLAGVRNAIVIRPALRAGLQDTLTRFSRELAEERELGGA